MAGGEKEGLQGDACDKRLLHQMESLQCDKSAGTRGRLAQCGAELLESRVVFAGEGAHGSEAAGTVDDCSRTMALSASMRDRGNAIFIRLRNSLKFV